MTKEDSQVSKYVCAYELIVLLHMHMHIYATNCTHTC